MDYKKSLLLEVVYENILNFFLLGVDLVPRIFYSLNFVLSFSLDSFLMEELGIFIAMGEPECSRSLAPPHFLLFHQIIKLFFFFFLNLPTKVLVVLSLLKGLEVMLSSFYFFEIMPKFCLPQL
jgi:hypothetical protein